MEDRRQMVKIRFLTARQNIAQQGKGPSYNKTGLAFCQIAGSLVGVRFERAHESAPRRTAGPALV